MSRKKRKDIFVELEIESIGAEGIAIARKDNIVHFVKNACPGDRVRVQILKKRKRYIQCRLVEILEPSPHRIDPQCRYYEDCGGCSWQHLDYGQQLFWKKVNVRDAFERIGHFEDLQMNDTLPAPDIFYYRNKMEFSFGASRWLSVDEIQSGEEITNRNFALGLHAPGRYDRIVDLDKCLIQPEQANELLDAFRNKALELHVSAYDTKINDGFLRNLVVRSTKANNELMIVLITKSPEKPEEKEMIRWLGEQFEIDHPYVTNVFHAVNDSNSPVAIGEIEILKGKPFITEEILGVKFRISPFSFFQTNPSQLDRFVTLILYLADIKEGENVWDLYCGTGSITLPAAGKANSIVGIELNPDAVEDAKSNAELNNIDTVQFYCADLHTKDLPDLLSALPNPDLIIVDPPRAGMHKNLINHILETAPERIVYVSCNPATQARDCELLSDKYDVVGVHPVDMFPHTFHIEAVAQLRRKSS